MTKLANYLSDKTGLGESKCETVAVEVKELLIRALQYKAIDINYSSRIKNEEIANKFITKL